MADQAEQIQGDGEPAPGAARAPATRVAVTQNPYEAALRQRALLLRVVRIGFVILFAVVTGLSLIGGPLAGEDASKYWYITLAFAFVVAVLVIAADMTTPKKKISTIVGVIVGLLAAMLATAALGFIIDLLAATYGDINPDNPPALIGIMKILIGTGLAYLAISTVLQTQDDFRLVIPYVEFAKQIRGQRPLVLDTSALVDGRFTALTETGLIQAPVLVPRFVVEELHRLSDSADKLKRARGRRGLDLVNQMQRSGKAGVTIDETPVSGVAVDLMLVELSRQHSALLVTTDSGLARVASIEGVTVINVHDIASALRPSVVPGETVRVRLVKVGEQPGQGVGYLEDGTMVVADDGEDRVGEELDLFVTSSLQTSAGRMIFARTTREAPGESAASPVEPPGPQQTPGAPNGAGSTERAPSRRNPRR